MTRLFRSDDPATPVDIPGRPVRDHWTSDLEPTPAPATRATQPRSKPSAPNNPTRGDDMKQTKPTREQQAKRDAAERIRARQDDAVAHLRQAHKRRDKGTYKGDTAPSAAGTNPAPEPAPASAESAFEAMKNAWRK